jgi:hypothetical protein
MKMKTINTGDTEMQKVNLTIGMGLAYFYVSTSIIGIIVVMAKVTGLGA